jgi:hypothetical protein
MRWTYLLLAATVAACTAFSTAQADPYDHHEGHWYHGSIHHFHDRDFYAWRGGRWYHGAYGGRLGWWWIVGGVYYSYPGPVYPYPDPYVPPEAFMPGTALPPGPPPVAQATPPAPPYPQAPAVPQAAPPGGAQMWYYCDASRNYYPYVPSCPSGWRPVPASPSGTP